MSEIVPLIVSFEKKDSFHLCRWSNVCLPPDDDDDH